MEQALHSVQSKPEHSVDIVVHIDEEIEEDKRYDIVNELKNSKGIYSAEFCPLRFHLMVLGYDRDLINSKEVLARVESQKVHAQLVGPI